jgi:hypothetical protein
LPQPSKTDLNSPMTKEGIVKLKALTGVLIDVYEEEADGEQ